MSVNCPPARGVSCQYRGGAVSYERGTPVTRPPARGVTCDYRGTSLIRKCQDRVTSLIRNVTCQYRVTSLIRKGASTNEVGGQYRGTSLRRNCQYRGTSQIRNEAGGARPMRWADTAMGGLPYRGTSLIRNWTLQGYLAHKKTPPPRTILEGLYRSGARTWRSGA